MLIPVNVQFKTVDNSAISCFESCMKKIGTTYNIDDLNKHNTEKFTDHEYTSLKKVKHTLKNGGNVLETVARFQS